MGKEKKRSKKVKEKKRSKHVKVQHGGRALPNDVVAEILSRLPLKSVLRYTCVSKNWNSLISHKSFKKLHHQRSLNYNPLSLLVLHYSWQYLTGVKKRDHVLTTLDLHDGEVLQQWDLHISSLNLRMLSFPSQSKLVCFADTKRFILCNPSIRELMYLPDPPSDPLLVLDDYAYGFGYVPSKDEYIIMHFVNPCSPLVNISWSRVIRTFSTSDDDTKLHYNALRSIDATLPRIHIMDLRPEGVFVCGAFYWMMWDRDNSMSLLTFDTENEVFSTVRLPMQVLMNNENISSDYKSLVEIKDELYYMSIRPKARTLRMWKLSGGKNPLWTLTSDTDLQRFFYRYIPPIPHQELEGAALIYRRKYLPYDDEAKNILREMRKLSILDVGIYAPKS